MSDRLEGIRVLIVDDDRDVLEAFETALQSEGAETLCVDDGNKAVAVCAEDPPDIVLLDMMLPKRSGFLVLEKIMEIENPPIVVMITANQGKRHMAYAKALGVGAYLIKPVSLQRLVDTVVGLLDENGAGAAG